MKKIFADGSFKYIFLFQVLTCLLINTTSYSQDTQHQKDLQKDDSLIVHRQHMIHSNSHMVMPFDMNMATHYFIKGDNGGTIMIKSKERDDSTQTALIRNHLKKEEQLFSNADFKDPKTLHGKDMPGLDILSSSKGKFDVKYYEIPQGAELIFNSQDTTVIHAIHEWFDAQLRDHGKDAKSRLD